MSFSPSTALVLDQQSWDYYYSLVEFPSFPQSYPYGFAKSQTQNLSVVRLLLLNNNGTPYAISQILIQSFFGLFSIARINRGPLLLPPFSLSEDNSKLAFSAIKSIHKLDSKTYKFNTM